MTMNFLFRGKREATPVVVNEKKGEKDKMLLADYVKIFQTAKGSFKAGNYENCISLFKECLSLGELINDEVRVIEAGFMLSSSLFASGAYGEINDYLEKCLRCTNPSASEGSHNNLSTIDFSDEIQNFQLKIKVLTIFLKLSVILNNLNKCKTYLAEIIEYLKSENFSMDLKLIMLKAFIKTLFTHHFIKMSGSKKMKESVQKFLSELENIRTDVRFNQKTVIKPELKYLLQALMNENLPLLIKFLNEKFYFHKYVKTNNNNSTTTNTLVKLIGILNKNSDSFQGKTVDKIKLTVESLMRVNKLHVDFKHFDSNLEKFIIEWKSRTEMIDELKVSIVNLYDHTFKMFEGENVSLVRTGVKKFTYQLKGGKLILDPINAYESKNGVGSLYQASKPKSPVKSNSTTKVNFYKKQPITSGKTISSHRGVGNQIKLEENEDKNDAELKIMMNRNIESLFTKKEKKIRKGSMNEFSMENFFKSVNITKTNENNTIDHLYNKGKKALISNLQKTKNQFINISKKDESSNTSMISNANVNTGSTQTLTPSPKNIDVFEYKHLKIDKKELQKLGKLSSKTPTFPEKENPKTPSDMSLNPSPVRIRKVENKQNLEKKTEKAQGVIHIETNPIVLKLSEDDQQNQRKIEITFLLKLIDHLKKNQSNDWFFDNKQQNAVIDYSYKTKNGRYYNNTEKINQDSYFLFEHFMMIKNFYFFGVCDGHGSNGHYASEHAKHYIPANLLFLEMEKSLSPMNKNKLSSLNQDLDNLTKNAHNSTNTLKYIYEKLRLGAHSFSFCKKLYKDIYSNISEAFKKTHEDIKQRKFESDFSGTTVCSVFILGKYLYCANLGDSRAVMASAKNDLLIPVPLSQDHKPDNEDEKKRILSCNGRVEPYMNDFDLPVGPARVWQQNVDSPGLAMSRSIGDCVASKIGVISDPEINEYILKPNDKFIIIASDGIWEFISNEKAVEIVTPYYYKRNPADACNELINVASKLWMSNEKSVDDITCIVIFLDVKS